MFPCSTPQQTVQLFYYFAEQLFKNNNNNNRYKQFVAGVCVGLLKRFVMRRLEWLKQKQQKPNNKSRSKKGRSKQDLIIKHKSWYFNHLICTQVS